MASGLGLWGHWKRTLGESLTLDWSPGRHWDTPGAMGLGFTRFWGGTMGDWEWVWGHGRTGGHCGGQGMIWSVAFQTTPKGTLDWELDWGLGLGPEGLEGSGCDPRIWLGVLGGLKGKQRE